MTTKPDFPIRSAQAVLDLLHDNRQQLYDLGVRKLGLFGSVVRGEATPDGDIDLLVVMARPSFKDYMDAKFFLEDLLGGEVDLVMESGLKPALRPYISKEVIYVKE
jgi:hypothetical protein